MPFNFKEQALEAAYYANLAYKKSSHSVENNSLYFEDRKTYQYWAFRGSNDLKDVLTDISAYKVKRDRFEGKLHNGFIDSWESLRPFVLDKVSKTKNVYVTGHSLGAAIATLCATELKVNKINLKPVYTFGQPRIGNSDWKKYFDSTGVNLTRIVNGYDAVARVPKLFYYHVGTPFYMQDGKVLKSQPTLFTGFNVFGNSYNKANDHEMANYIKSLERLP